jgi:hypothetical protein
MAVAGDSDKSRAGGHTPYFENTPYEVEFGICYTHHTRTDRVRLQLTATSFVASIHDPILQANPARRGRFVPPPDKCEFVHLQKINNLVSPPPFIWSNTVEVPHPNVTNIISIRIGT